MNDREKEEPHPDSSKTGRSGEFSAAMGRLEKAVQELVSVTTGELSERATSVIDETSKRLEAELRLKRATNDDPEAQQDFNESQRRHRSRHSFSDEVQGHYSTLYIDKGEEKVAGVCAGLARYFGMETWVVRMGALTGLVFMPQIVFPAYWIMYFVMEKKPDNKAPSRRSRRRGWRRRRGQPHTESSAAESPADSSRGRENETEAKRTSRDLRHVTTDLTQAELRLRRMESFVTSDRYELHRELAKIEKGEV